MAQNQEIILYHYSFSPYARRIVWYLSLRQIPYSQCIQPPLLPRPDLKAIGISYRRIPLLSIGRSIYTDTRLILSKLDELYPPSATHPSISPSPSNTEHLALTQLLEFWAVDGGLFARGTQLIPPENPLLSDAKFQEDRKDYTGRSWTPEAVIKNRPEALVDIRGHFETVERLILGDGREWVLGGGGPGLADIEAIWLFHWLSTLPGALPPSYISAAQFPKVFSWIERFTAHERAAAHKVGKPKTIKGPEALERVCKSDFAETNGKVDEDDPTGLKEGQEVDVWPIDSGFKHKDRGRLVRLDGNEIVVEKENDSGVTVRIHAPRHGFRVSGVEGSKL
ncbi:glutathione s-transferase-related protein-like protein [Amylocarpus encephaloides]|uniref:Glutathione s-transferase-related protein-like protein n=1 Tax=Amylocarpus encephaloides TaxID=45428 RepID=A0A9P7YAC5_9HELO|nr:glutathione s-transferase-related protein-like protein [Amylocarpus encephaloides]